MCQKAVKGVFSNNMINWSRFEQPKYCGFSSGPGLRRSTFHKSSEMFLFIQPIGNYKSEARHRFEKPPQVLLIGELQVLKKTRTEDRVPFDLKKNYIYSLDI